MDKPKDDLDAVRIVVATLESFDNEARERIFRWAAEKLDMHPNSHITKATIGALPHKSVLQPKSAEVIDLKSFVDEKIPKNDMHFAATVAYYYLYESCQDDRKETINKEILSEAVRVVKWRQGLNNPGQTLLNAFNAGLLDRTGDRGEYKLNMVDRWPIVPRSGTVGSRLFVQ
ncbi:MAG: hypothetical protein ABIE07_00325 [Candidatus Zixiibacteriota bacterium]